jgi:hypothetical protein
VQAPHSLVKDSDIELRCNDFVGGWDVSLNYPIILSLLSTLNVMSMPVAVL